MATLHIQATGTGRVVSRSQLKQGTLRDVSRLGSMFFTTTLPNVITDVIDVCGSLDKDYCIETVMPSRASSASLDLIIKGDGFRVICARRLVRGLFPLNPFAPEFGRNYDVIVTVNADDDEVRDKIIDTLRDRYPCKALF